MRFISISRFPGKMGETIFNAAFKKMKIQASYKAIKKYRLGNLKSYLFKNKIIGCGISMPFKETIIKSLDKLDHSVKITNSCNTIVLKRRKIVGYNTDLLGIIKILTSKKIPKHFEFYIFGAGGYARSFYKALESLRYSKIYVINKSSSRFNSWPSNNKINILKKFPKFPYQNVIVNATPIGMKQTYKKEYLSKLNLRQTKYYFECVVSPKITKNILIAKKKSIKFILGYEISIEQAIIQFQIYVKKKVSRLFIKNKLKNIII